MALFSERYGYTKPRDVLIRESMPQELANGICSAYDYLRDDLRKIESRTVTDSYEQLEEVVWVSFLNKRADDYKYSSNKFALIPAYILLPEIVWFKKLDLVEFSIKVMKSGFKHQEYLQILNDFKQRLNTAFRRLGYVFRVVNDEIVEISSEEEIVEIEKALTVSDTISIHLNTSLELLSKRPEGDYRNSIKESICAVEVICREITGASTLGDALINLKKKKIDIPSILENAFTKLYVYTNDKTTGIRHALLDDSNEPGYDEAKFMLVACSAFVNYLKAKTSLIK